MTLDSLRKPKGLYNHFVYIVLEMANQMNQQAQVVKMCKCKACLRELKVAMILARQGVAVA